MSNFYQQVYEVVKKIPRGKVMTYGQIAQVLGNPKSARAVGNALHNNPDPDTIFCHRVVNMEGGLAKNFGAWDGLKEQQRRLEGEDVEVIDGSVDLKKYQYVFKGEIL